MAKGRSPSEIKSRTVRVNIGDWRLLMMMSKRAEISMAEALHKLLIQQVPGAKPMIRPAIQPVYRVPVAQVALRYASQPAIATNGNKGIALGIKSKGVRCD